MSVLFILLLLVDCSAQVQQNILLFKQEHKNLPTFFKCSVIAFQLHNRTWQKGKIVQLQNDSIYTRPAVVFPGGLLLKKFYHYTLTINKRFYFQMVKL